MIYINRLSNKLSLPGGPYCDHRLGFFETFIVKSKSIYKCRCCGRRSSVNIENSLLNLLWCVQIFSILIFVLTLVFNKFLFLGFFLIFLVFGAFYGLSPYMVSLEEPIYILDKKSNKRRKSKKRKKSSILNVLVSNGRRVKKRIYKKKTKRPEKNDDSFDIYSN